MSTTVISDAMVMPATESQPAATKLITETTEVKLVKCECCGLTEDCTPEYIQRIRERYQGKWICGLCSEAVKDEIVRSNRLITTDEAMARHVSFCRSPISSNPTAHLISAMRRILRRSLDSPRSVPCSPVTKVGEGVVVLARSESCIPDITFVVDSCSCREAEDGDERSKDTDTNADADAFISEQEKY